MSNIVNFASFKMPDDEEPVDAESGKGQQPGYEEKDDQL